ncbi:hypothetical protein ACFQBQ_11395 [Granulicella cerasi]|uniref:Uncharacterized protein n=1 Tax=Granulicella cerasi TaxID=741063 RepID=A0ABW1ZCP3_9BACT|nr:hypothetical protein [Granulicella cerasi]
MQNAKDTFYEVLRARLASVNPLRTAVVRGSVRPAVVVEENELSEVALPLDCFRLRWVGVSVDARGALPRVAMRCEIAYATAGTSERQGMDRGRVLAAMDAELLQMVNAEPRDAVKQSYAAAGATTLGTKIWWSAVTFGEVKVADDVVSRVATVDVMAFEEAGER